MNFVYTLPGKIFIWSGKKKWECNLLSNFPPRLCSPDTSACEPVMPTIELNWHSDRLTSAVHVNSREMKYLQGQQPGDLFCFTHFLWNNLKKQRCWPCGCCSGDDQIDNTVAFEHQYVGFESFYRQSTSSLSIPLLVMLPLQKNGIHRLISIKLYKNKNTGSFNSSVFQLYIYMRPRQTSPLLAFLECLCYLSFTVH